MFCSQWKESYLLYKHQPPSPICRGHRCLCRSSSHASIIQWLNSSLLDAKITDNKWEHGLTVKPIDSSPNTAIVRGCSRMLWKALLTTQMQTDNSDILWRASAKLREWNVSERTTHTIGVNENTWLVIIKNPYYVIEIKNNWVTINHIAINYSDIALVHWAYFIVWCCPLAFGLVSS